MLWVKDTLPKESSSTSSLDHLYWERKGRLYILSQVSQEVHLWWILPNNTTTKEIGLHRSQHDHDL